MIDNETVTIRLYRSEDQRSFERLNREWIERHFVMEPVDSSVLRDPATHILSPGGAILMADYKGEVAGTVALRKVTDMVYEFTKMAVDEKYRGLKIGRALGEAAIRTAIELGATTIILYSNTKLAPAISLYRKLGFTPVPLDGPYKRSNIKMELNVS